MSVQTILGRFEGNSSFRTAKGVVTLTSLAPEEVRSAAAHPFLAAREFEGHYAILSGDLRGRVLHQPEIDELVPPKTSLMVTRLIESKAIDMDRLRRELEAAELTVTGADPIVIESSPGMQDAIPRMGRPLCALVVGHRESDKGTRATFAPRTWEWTYNKRMAKLIAARVQNVETQIVFRDDDKGGYARLPGQLNELDPAFIVSLHCNAVADPGPGGTEMLHYHKSSEGKKLAGLLQREVLSALGLRDRKIKAKTINDRGGHLLKNTNAPAVITEPFFMSNEVDWNAGNLKQEELADACARAIDAYAATLRSGPKCVTVNKPVSPRTTEDPKTIRLKHANLSKDEFFTENREELAAILAGVNARLATEYGAGANPLTRGQAFAVLYAEMGLVNGRIDPNHRHSEGERGIFPLPDNIRFWNGNQAPNPKEPMPIVQNVEEFMLYLGQLKNKSVKKSGGLMLYRDLFRQAGIMGSERAGMNLLAGVVHGYFFSGTYRCRQVPRAQILAGIAAGTRISEVMTETDYVHAGKTLMVNREKNLATGFRLA